MKQNRARYSTTCFKCKKNIYGEKTGTSGDFIQWSKKPPVRRYHVNCTNPQVWPYPQDEAPKPLPSRKCQSCGCDVGLDQAYCTLCQAQFYAPQQQEAPIPNPDELFDMKIPEDNPKPKSPVRDYHAPSNGSDALLDLISEKVEAKVIDDITIKVNLGIQRIDKMVQDKLDKLAIPSIEVKRVDLPNIKLENVHKQFKDVLQLLSSSEHVYLHGSPGGHKTSLGRPLAEALGVRFEGCSLSEQTPDYTIKGFTSPIDGKFYESKFCDFYENGGLWQWSEIDAANDNFRVSLNTALDNGYMSTDKGSINRHDKFYMIADGNTCGRGAHPAFPSRTAFDSAFAARFIFVQFEYDWNLCKHIALGLNKQSGPIVSWAEKVSNWALVNGVQLVMSPREVYKLAKLMVTTTLSDSMLLDGILRGLDIASKEKLLTNYPFPSISRS
jgi:dynein-related subfamily AAA family protein